MFMDKNELKNIAPLTRVKLRNNKRGLIWFELIATLLFLVGITATLGTIFENADYVKLYSMQDYSILFFVVIVITLLTLTIAYRQMNDLYFVYPQTNNTRFISTLLFQYIFIIIVAVTFLVQYLIQYSLFKLLSHFNNNIILALDFNVGFVIVGFLTYLMYAFLLTSVFSFLGVILHRIGYYSILIAATLLSILIVNLNWSIQFFSKILFFFSKEPSIMLFFVKIVLIWVVITAVALILNKNMVYNITQKRLPPKLILLCISIVLCVILFSNKIVGTGERTGSSSGIITYNSPSMPFRMSEIVLDVSDLSKGSELKIAYNDNIIYQSNGDSYNSGKLYYTGEDTIVIQSDNLYVYYHYSRNSTNGYTLSDYIHPTMTAAIKGDTLYINYEYDKNIKVVALPAWSMASQFEIYDENIVKNGFLKYSSSGSGNIFVTDYVLEYE